MNTYDFVHLALLATGGRIRGKTKLQKTIYFLGKLTGCLDDLGYGAHYYGPYSPAVAEAADRLVALGFVDQTVAGGGAHDSQGFEVARYDFALNEEGKQVAERKSQEYEQLWEKLRGAADVLRCAGDLDYIRLSVAAKTDFMLDRKGGESSVGELAKLARAFGWVVSPDDVHKAAEFLQTLGLVKLTKSS